MAYQTWEVIKTRYCGRAGCKVALEAKLVYPATWMPDSPPRRTALRCNHGLICNEKDQTACTWSGTNPAFDPFKD